MRSILILAALVAAADACEECGGRKIESAAVAEAPDLDGRADDAAWARARWARVPVRESLGEPAEATLRVKSVHTRTHVYFLVTWEDATEDRTHKPWTWNGTAYEIGPEREDVLSLAFEHAGTFDADMLSGTESVWDVWHWKAARTDPAGYAMDKLHRHLREKPEGKAKSHEAAGGSFVWIARPEDAGDSLQVHHAAPATRAGDRVAQYAPGAPTGSAADVRAKGSWTLGRWTVELGRRLDTGHADDTALDPARTTKMGFAVFDREEDADHSASEVWTLAFVPGLPVAGIEEVTGIKGVLRDGELKLAVPQKDLDVRVDGFPIVPPMGTTSWVVFVPHAGEAMLMGDLVLLEDEVAPVQKALVQGGIRVTALHNHFLRDEPKAMFLHVGGSGAPLDLARGVRGALDRVAELRRAKGLAPTDREAPGALDAAALADLVGREGRLDGGVWKAVLGRPEIDLREDGVEVTAFAGFNTWIAFQGTMARAAVAGDFVMLPEEVPAVVEALVAHGIEVTALHNHMLAEEPRVLFLHYWGVGPAPVLARGLRAALDAQR